MVLTAKSGRSAK